MANDKLEERIASSLDAAKVAFAAAMAAVEGPFGEREGRALALANELARSWLEAELTRVAGSFEDEVEVGTQRYRRHAEGTGLYHSLAGCVRVRRFTYRQLGLHNGPTVVPLDLAVGMREHATPALAYSALQGFAAMPLRHYEAAMAAAHRTVPSRSTLERICKRVGAAIVDDVSLLERPCAPPSGCRAARTRSRWASTGRRWRWRRPWAVRRRACATTSGNRRR